MTARPYVTQRQHLKYPKGTRCMAERSPDGRTIFLEFEDGTLVSLMASQYYLKGLETEPDPTVASIEDEKAIEALDAGFDPQCINCGGRHDGEC